jgi:hypothetical protein
VRILGKMSRYKDIQGKDCIRQAWEKLTTSGKWGSYFKEKRHRKKKNMSKMTKKNPTVQKSDTQIIRKLELNNYPFFREEETHNHKPIETSNIIYDDGFNNKLGEFFEESSIFNNLDDFFSL